MGITRGQFQIDYKFFCKNSVEQYIFHGEITPGKLEAKHYNLEMTIYTKKTWYSHFIAWVVKLHLTRLLELLDLQGLVI